MKSIAVISISCAVVLSTQGSVAYAKDPVTITVTQSENYAHVVAQNTWEFQTCSTVKIKGSIQQKIKGKWINLKKVKKPATSLTPSQSPCPPDYPITQIWRFVETKKGKKEYRFKEAGSSWNKKFKIVATDGAPAAAPAAAPGAAPGAAPTVAPTAPAPIRPPSSLISSLSYGLDSAIDTALAQSLASGDISCAVQMQDLSQRNFSGLQWDYQNGYITEYEAVRKLEAGWTLVGYCS